MVDFQTYKAILFLLIGIIIVVLNYKYKRYEITSTNSDHIIVSRFAMTPKHIYGDDIISITIINLKNDKQKAIINYKNKKMNIKDESIFYTDLVNFSKRNKVAFFHENIRGIKKQIT